MEETRVIHLYLDLLKKRAVGIWDFVWGGGWMRSGAVTGVFLALLMGAAFFTFHERGRGHLSKLKTKMTGAAPAAPSGPKPGGMDPLILTRSESAALSVPEFASLTLLPGLGMSVLQINAFIPGHGQVPLLAAPSVEEMAAATPPAQDGPNDVHGALEFPWAGVLTGIPAPVGNQMVVRWLGQPITVSTLPSSRGRLEGGLLRSMGATEVAPDVVPEGASVKATFESTDFSGDWPGKVETKVSVLMEGSRMELGVVATNTGSTPVPVGVGWHPRFAVPGDRRGVLLKLPEAERLERAENGLPTGKTIPANAALTQFMGKKAVALGGVSLDDLLVELKPALLEDGAAVEVRFPEGGYGIRMKIVSASIHGLRVVAEPGKPYISLGPQVNMDDPLGREWEHGAGAQMTVLGPGMSMEWRLKLELFSLSGETGGSRL